MIVTMTITVTMQMKTATTMTNDGDGDLDESKYNDILRQPFVSNAFILLISNLRSTHVSLPYVAIGNSDVRHTFSLNSLLALFHMSVYCLLCSVLHCHHHLLFDVVKTIIICGKHCAQILETLNSFNVYVVDNNIRFLAIYRIP